MTKQQLVLKYFQKADQLSSKNPNYCTIISSLFHCLIANDQAQNDLTSKYIFSQKSLTSSGKIITNDNIVTAGLDEIAFLLTKYTQLSIEIRIKDGQKTKKGEIIAEISGDIYQILAYERTILNILQRMSGIATETNHLIKKVQGNIPFLAATRKTPWGLLDKKAVALGGGLTHRLNLADEILIKDNHLAILKKHYQLKTEEETVVKALEIIFMKKKGKNTPGVARRDSPGVKRPAWVKESKRKLIEIEVETKNQASAAVETFKRLANNHYCLAIMFDNFSHPRIRKAISSISSLAPLAPIIFEASGGITKNNLLFFAQTGVDIISLGSLTHSPKAADLSFKI